MVNRDILRAKLRRLRASTRFWATDHAHGSDAPRLGDALIAYSPVQRPTVLFHERGLLFSAVGPVLYGDIIDQGVNPDALRSLVHKERPVAVQIVTASRTFDIGLADGSDAAVFSNLLLTARRINDAR